ncbi:hypothetical protein RRF57_003875 [Xylaria bambusicola]|uniref:Uncharacterized protein n=1 Tax=Xylaria bambusicola TaxID=326684 RepID=A0AAN7YWN2_9PEZI
MSRQEGRIPKVIFLDAANCPELTNLGSSTQYLDANMGPYLDGGVLVVSELRRGGIWIPLDVLGNQLDVDLSTSLPNWAAGGRHSDTYVG